MKKMLNTLLCTCLFVLAGCSDDKGTDKPDTGDRRPATSQELAHRNLERSIALIDTAVDNYFTGETMSMSRYYNPYTGSKSGELGSIWMYTSAIEAVNAAMHGMSALKSEGDAELYDAHFARYAALLGRLYDNAAYYRGSFTLTSYTQTREWSVYAVNRANGMGSADVTGINNVYDDQQWLVRELLEAYRLTGDSKYLSEAEYLTAYVLDGWDCTLDGSGNEHGGITWGPGYTTKHSCSNGPMISPLVWLHEIYSTSTDEIDHRYIDAAGRRLTRKMPKGDYYLMFARKIYDWQKSRLLRADGVYADMLGGSNRIEYETVDGERYRKHTQDDGPVGAAITYNSGTMLSGAADLYRATGQESYLADMRALSKDSFAAFARLGEHVEGHYSFDISGFRVWFDNVLMRGYADVARADAECVATCIDAFQSNLDYAYARHLYKGSLPTNLLVGWNMDKGKNDTEAMFAFAFAAEYAALARHEAEKND